MKVAILAFTVAFGLAVGTPAQDKKDDKAARLALAIDDLAKAAKSLGVKPLTEEQKKAAEPLQGTWTVTKVVENGKPAAEATLKKLTLVVKEQAFVFFVDSEPRPAFIKWIDGTKKPKEFDLDCIVDDHARPTLYGIYAIEEKTLRIALALEEGKRPTSFESREGDKRILAVLKKVQ